MRVSQAGVQGGWAQGATLTCFCTPLLFRIVEVEQDNKMTPGNLGIVFGPTLLRPRPTEATVSLSSLVDYPHQARIVETLITHYELVFEEKPEENRGQVRWQVDQGKVRGSAHGGDAGWGGPGGVRFPQGQPPRGLLSKVWAQIGGYPTLAHPVPSSQPLGWVQLAILPGCWVLISSQQFCFCTFWCPSSLLL